MPKTCSILKAKGYILLSLPCDDGRLRYSTGVKDTEDLSKKDAKRVDDIKEAINNYVLKYSDILKEQVKVAELRAHLDKQFNPDKLGKRKSAGDFVGDHKKMLEAMRTGAMLKKKSKKRYSLESIDQFERMRQRWEECAADKESGFVLSYEMTKEHVNKLIVWLVRNEYAQNSIYNIVNNLKIYLTWSFNEGKHNNEVYKDSVFSVPQEEADAIAPTYAEIEAFYKHPFTKLADIKHRDFFVYGCFLSLRVKDLRRINNYHLVGDIFEVLTKKTDKKVTIPCHWIAKEIYHKYNGQIPIVWRQNLAKKLPKLCEAAGITGKKLITYTVAGVKVEKYYERYQLIQPHTMRRFFATWMYYELKYPPKAIMPITGHKSEAQFLKYVKIEDELNAKEIASSPAFQKPV